MSIEAQTVEYTYVGDGATTQFPFPSKFLSPSDIRVGLDGVEQIGGFTAVGAGDDAGGYISFPAAPAVGVVVLLLREPPMSQLVDFINGQTILEGILDNALDKLTMICQYLRRVFNRTLRLSDFDRSTLGTIPDAATRAGKLLGFGLTGGIALVTPGPGNGTITSGGILDSTAAGRAILTAADAAAQRTLLGVQPSSVQGFGTRALAIATPAPDELAQITLLGRDAPYDGGGGTYVRLAVAPGAPKAWHFQTANGVWFELREFFVRPKMLGAKIDGATSDLTALQAWVDYSAAFKAVAKGSPGTAAVPSGSVNFVAGARIEGDGEMTLLRATDVVEPLILAMSLDKPYIKGLRFSYTAGVTSTSNYSPIAAGPLTFGGVAANGFVVNQFVIIRPTAQQQHYMIARVNSYSAGLLAVTVTSSNVVGGGPYNSWFIQSYTDSSGGGYSPAAIRADFCTNPTITENEITGRFFIGIGVKNTSRAKITGNRIKGASDRGIENNSLTGASNVNVDNEITGNTIEGDGWLFYGINSAADGGNQTGLIVSGNHIRDALVHGVSCSGQIYRPNIQNNNIKMFTTGAGGYGIGILLQNLAAQFSIGAAVIGNNVTGGLHGVYIIDAQNFVVQGNSIELAGAAGVKVQSITTTTGAASVIGGNSVRNCAGSGIYADAAVGFSISAISISGNSTALNGGWGILTTANTNLFSITGNVSSSDTAGKISSPGTGHVAAGNA